MKKILPHPVLSLILWIIWLLLNNTVAPGHLILGAILAMIIPLLTTEFLHEKVCMRHPVTLVKFLMVVFWDILVANLVVAKLILGNKDKLQPVFLHIPLDIKEPLTISLFAHTISLAPGTLSCDLSEDKKTLLVHGLHEEDPQAAINGLKERYEQPLKRMFESC